MSEETGTLETTSHDRLFEALHTVIEVVIGEDIRALGRSIIEQGESLNRRIDALEVRLDEMSERTEQGAAGLKDEVRESLASTRSDLQQDFTARETTMRERLDGLTRTLAGVQAELLQQTKAAGQMSTLFDNLGAVFQSRPPATTPMPHAADAPPESDFIVVDEAEASGADGQGKSRKGQGLDSTLDDVLGGE